VAAGALAAPADAPRVAELRGMLEEQRTRVLRMKAVRDESLALEHEVETAQRTYDTVVGRLNQTHLQGQAPQNNAYVLSQATPPRLPSSPKMLLNAAVSVVVGLLLASCAVIGLERIDPRVRTAQEASTLIGVPLLGVLPAPDAPPLFTPRKTPLARPKVTSLLSAPSKEA
jgi:ABC-type Na+ efflux pump permease subunit